MKNDTDFFKFIPFDKGGSRMASDWRIVAFPLILPWREEFWTLPLYFPDLQVGVVPGWPAQMPYQGLPLPPEAQFHSQELKHYQPGDLRQWQAFTEYQQAQAEGTDLLRDLRHYGQAEPPPEDSSPQGWTLAWQMEKLQADQEAQMSLVDQGQEWLREILTPEPWEDRPSFGQAPGIQETVDPDLARLRYALWRRIMAPQLQGAWTPFLLGRTSRALFLTLKGWPQWTGLKKAVISLPGCRSFEEYRQICGPGGAPPWQEEAVALLAALLGAAGDLQQLETAAQQWAKFLANAVIPQWPYGVAGNFDVEVWVPEAEDERPVLCWSEAGAGILPG
jgi:hypothetical protein